MRWLFFLLVVVLLALWSAACARSYNNDIVGQDANRPAPAGHSITSGLTCATEPSCSYSFPGLEPKGNFKNNPEKQLAFQLYITPEDRAIKALATQINDAENAYQMAVQWIYVSDEKLHQSDDKWLTPHEFLTGTPYYSSNPLQGDAVSDCEEKANTLVSLIRAQGVRPEEVRVAIGEVKFNSVKTGHAWVELLTNGHWLALDPSWGPYWDNKAVKLIRRDGIRFNYYADNTYPALQVWAYYNDVYYLDPGDASGNAPASWHEDAPAR